MLFPFPRFAVYHFQYRLLSLSHPIAIEQLPLYTNAMRFLIGYLLLAQCLYAQGMLYTASGKAFTASFQNAETPFVNPADLSLVNKELAAAGTLNVEKDNPLLGFASVTLRISKHVGLGLSFRRSSVRLLQRFTLVKDEGLDSDEKQINTGVFYTFTRSPILEADQTALGEKFPNLDKEEWGVAFGMEIPNRLDMPIYWGFQVRQVKDLVRAKAQAGEFGNPNNVQFHSRFSTFTFDSALTAYLKVKFFSDRLRKRVGFGFKLKNINEPVALSPLEVQALNLPIDLFSLKREWQVGTTLEWSPRLKFGLSQFSGDPENQLRFGLIYQQLRLIEKSARYKIALGLNKDALSFGIQRVGRHVKLSYTLFQHESAIYQKKFLQHLFSISYLP